MLNALFGLSYGGIIAGSYLIAKLTGVKGGADVTCIASFILFIVHIVLWPKLTTLAFTDWRNSLRGFLYGITQIFLFMAQDQAPTSTMLIASIAGALAGAWIGRLILKEHPSWNEIVAMLVAVGGTMLGFSGHIEANIWALLGGLIQGVTGVAARSLMKSKVSRRGAVGSGFFMLGVVMLVWLTVTKSMPPIANINSLGIIAVAIAAAASQYAFFQLYKIYSTQKATVFTLLRAPWGVALEGIFLGAGVGILKIISSVIVFLAALIALYRPKQSKSTSSV